MSALNLPIDPRTLGYLLLTVVFVGGAITPAAGMAAVDAGDGVPAQTASAQTTTAQTQVSVGVGQQLSTVLFASSEEVQTAFENSAFEAELETENESERAAAVADRASQLRLRAQAIREDHTEARRAYEAGEITASEYARRLATLHSRAANLLESVARLNERAETVSGLELRARGADTRELQASLDDLDGVTGVGAAALLRRFTGQAHGEVDLEVRDGLRIEVRSEAGERSREIERPRDDDDSITVNQSDALATAESALSRVDGEWVLRRASVHPNSGYYEFEFSLRSRADVTGEAEVRVDGSTGTVFRLEEEIESRDDDRDGDDRDGDDRDGELAVVVVRGTPSPNEVIVVQVTRNREPVAGATVRLNGREIGETNDRGLIRLTLPDHEAEIEARAGDAEGELEFEFEDDRDDHDVFRRLEVASRLSDGTVVVKVGYAGHPVEGAGVYANGEPIGRTNADGFVRFGIDDATDELELRIVKGEFEAELKYVIRGGELVLVESPHESDGDHDREDETDDDSRDDDSDDDDRDRDDSTDNDDDSTSDDGSDDDRIDRLRLDVIRGTVAAGAEVVVRVRADGTARPDADVWMNGHYLGETGEHGTIRVTLPEHEDDAVMEAEFGDAKGRLELEIDIDTRDG